MKMEKFNHKKGSLMIEAMISISLLTIGLLGIFTLITRSIHTNKDIQNRVTATYLAAEGIEVMKNIIDSNVETAYQDVGSTTWNASIVGNFEVQFDSRLNVNLTKLTTASSTNYLKFNKNNGVYSYTGGYESPYFRTIKVEGITSDSVRIKSFVEWTSDGNRQQVYLEDIFTNWRERTTPEYEY